MNKFLSSFLILAFLSSPVLAADQWTKGDPDGTEAPGTIDDIIRVNQAAQDRLLNAMRRGVLLIPSTTNTLTVLEGEIAISNAAVSVVRYRETTSSTTITWSDIDTGSEASATQYYVYATADTDITGMVFKISASSTSPSGSTYYRKIGYFYNNSSGEIVNVGNLKGGDATNIIQVTGSTDISTTSASATDMTDMEIRFVSSGRPVKLTFSAPFDQESGYEEINFDVDGTDYGRAKVEYDNHSEHTRGGKYGKLQWLLTNLSSGTHTLKVQWKAITGTINQKGSTDGERVFIAEEK